MSYILGLRESIPQLTYDRVRAFPNFEIVTGAPWVSAKMAGERVKLETPKGDYDVDMMISCIGMDVDFAARPELATFARTIRTWSDAYAAARSRKEPKAQPVSLSG